MEWIVAAAIGLIVAAFVFAPLLRGSGVIYDWDGTGASPERARRLAEIEADVGRYREALRAGTVCTRCREANPPGSRFCADCGRPLPNANATTEAHTSARAVDVETAGSGSDAS